MGEGHIASACRAQPKWRERAQRLNSICPEHTAQPGQHLMACNPQNGLNQSPGSFRIFGAWVCQAASTEQQPRGQPITGHGSSEQSMTGGPSLGETHKTDRAQLFSTVHNFNSVPRPSQTAPNSSNFTQINNVSPYQLHLQSTPRSSPLPQPQAHHHQPSTSHASIMAYQRADPTPFKPRGMTVLNIPNRPIMVRTMAHRRPRAKNEDLAIVTIDPIPGNVLHFPIVEEVIRECCHSKRASVKEVQPTHLGQGFVRFQHEYDRDRMVSDSPHLYGGSYFSFVKHNQGRNWKSLTFNFECWVMMMGLPEDY